MTYRPPDQDENRFPETSRESALTPLALDTDKYRDHLEEFDLTPEQQNELLETLWHILSTIVDIGFGLDSVQMLLPAWAENAGMIAGDSVKQIEGAHNFNQAAEGDLEPENLEEDNDE